MTQTVSFLDRKSMQEAARYLSLGPGIAGAAERAVLPDGMPIFLTEGERPHAELFAYGVHMSSTLAPQTQRQYAYTTKRFVDFLDEELVPLTQVTESVLARYRIARLSSGIAAASWTAEAMVVRRLIDFLIQTGRMPKRPWIEVGQKNVLSSTMRTTVNVRHLSARQWLVFRNIGLCGQLPDGSNDPSFRCNDAERNVLGSEIAIGTGMRLAEFSSLLVVEATAPGFIIQACAKRSRAREVFLVPRANRMAKSYVRGVRRAIVNSRQPKYRRISSSLLFVTDEDLHAGSVRLPGSNRRAPVSSLNPAIRRRLFIDRGGYLDPAALFIGETGLMLSTNAWSKVFRAASRRVARFPEVAQIARGVTAHDFRHTFAVRMMGHLVRAGVSAREDRLKNSGFTQQTLAEATSINPLIMVQKLLGHASPSTTAVYLRYVDDVKAIIERVLIEWDNEVGYLTGFSGDRE